MSQRKADSRAELAAWREAQLESFAASLRKRSAKFLPPPSIEAAVAPKSLTVLKTPPRPTPVAKASISDLKLAARRAGAAEAAARRQRTAALGDALRAPILHAAIDLWRLRCADGYKALGLYQELACQNGFDKWIESHAASLSQCRARYLRRWRVITRVASKRRSLACLLYTSPSPRDGLLSRMPSSA